MPHYPPQIDKDYHQSSSKYEKVQHFTNSHNQAQPQAHPRLPKVVTVTNTVALIVEIHPESIALYIFHMGVLRRIPVQSAVKFPYLKLGSWVIIGLYQNGRIASICPKPLLANPQPTKVDDDGHVMIFCTVSEGLHNGNDVGSKETLLNTMANKAEPSTAIWLKWVGIDKSTDFETSDSKFWEVAEFGKNEPSYARDFSEVEYRNCMEFARRRRRSEEACRFPLAANMYVARHYGVIMEHNRDKRTIGVWSVGLTSEDFHDTKWPMEYSKTLQKVVPESAISVGQWIHFDTTIEAAEQMSSRAFRPNNRLHIPEFVHCSTPKGIAVSQIGKNVKIVLTATYVVGTGHPMVYEIQDFGYVLAPADSLISGAYMQLVLERVNYSLRRNYGFGWRVIASEVVKPEFSEKRNEEDDTKLSNIQHQSISAIALYHREKFFLSTPVSQERVSSHHIGIQNSLNSKRYYEPWKESNHVYNDGFGKKRTHYNNTMNVVAMVEKIDFQKKCGILWVFGAMSAEVHVSQNAHPNGPLTNSKEKSICFTYLAEAPKVKTGSSIFASLVRKDDSSTRTGYRWVLTSYTEKKFATYNFVINTNAFHVFDEIGPQSLQPTLDKLGRHVYTGKNFSAIVDLQGSLHQNTLLIPYGVHPGYYVSLARKKIANGQFETNTRYAVAPEVFTWIITSFHMPNQPYQSGVLTMSPSAETIKPLMSEDPNSKAISPPPIPSLLQQVASPRRHKERKAD